MAEIFDVIGAISEIGLPYNIEATARNILVLGEDDVFFEDEYDEFLAVCEEIRDEYTDPYAARVFGKTASELTEEERIQMWCPESEGGLPMVQRRAILELWTDSASNYGIVLRQYYVDGVLYYDFGIREYGATFTGISFRTERGENPATIWFGEPLPVIPPTDGMVHTGWVNYYGEPVTSTAYDDLGYDPVFTAVWEEPSATTDHTVYRQEGGKWVKKHEEVKEVYQNKGGQWVKVSPVDAQ